MRRRIDRHLVIDALTLAIKRRCPVRGSFTIPTGEPVCECRLSGAVGQAQYPLQYEPQGRLLDNAPVESFFGTLKQELVFHQRYHSRQQARQSLFDYIDGSIIVVAFTRHSAT